MEIILASKSPRRREILENTKVRFSIEESQIDEVIKLNELPKETVMRLAYEKALDVANRNRNSLVIGADTIVVINDTILGKPKDDIEAFKDAFKDDLEYIQRAEDFIEVVPKSCSKATGIQTFIDLIGASIDDCISIGDSTNDLPMLTYTKESVAMGNSNPVLFDYVTYITTDIEDDGIYNALKHFNVI